LKKGGSKKKGGDMARANRHYIPGCVWGMSGEWGQTYTID